MSSEEEDEEGEWGDEDWNGRFQAAMALPETSESARLRKFSALVAVNRDFVSVASSYARTLIVEQFLPEDKKSVRPTPVGGIAGGQKFAWRGILFKFADGETGPYGGSDEAAAKALGHDLKGANQLLGCGIPGLNVSLQAVIDFHGFRMHAQAMLPVNSTTLHVGSADGGRTVHSSDAILVKQMHQAGLVLNLAPHTIRGVTLTFGCDVEGHLGHDGRRYVLDCARVFPPESPITAAHLRVSKGPTSTMGAPGLAEAEDDAYDGHDLGPRRTDQGMCQHAEDLQRDGQLLGSALDMAIFWSAVPLLRILPCFSE